MKVKFKVVGGKSDGKEIPVPGDQFIIGREEGCQLRVGSDAISRKHSCLFKKDGALFIKDLGSRNGTVVNGTKITAETQLNSGDKLAIGPLQLEVLIEYDLAGDKLAKVKDVKDVVARTVQKAEAKAKASEDELDLLAMMNADDDEDEETETQKFSLDDIKVVKNATELAADAKAAEEKAKKDEAAKKKATGKLPVKPTEDASTKDTRDAANQMLKKMFKK